MGNECENDNSCTYTISDSPAGVLYHLMSNDQFTTTFLVIDVCTLDKVVGGRGIVSHVVRLTRRINIEKVIMQDGICKAKEWNSKSI